MNAILKARVVGIRWGFSNPHGRSSLASQRVTLRSRVIVLRRRAQGYSTKVVW